MSENGDAEGNHNENAAKDLDVHIPKHGSAAHHRLHSQWPVQAEKSSRQDAASIEV